jgi:protein phosphatase PTC6
MFAGLYDGYVHVILVPAVPHTSYRHGGSAVSQFLRQEFHGLFENVEKSTILETCEWVRELGGYFRRFDGGVLKPWLSTDATSVGPVMDLTARSTLAFFTADRQLGVQAAHKCGATASVVLLHALDCPQPAFFASQKLAITVAHAGWEPSSSPFSSLMSCSDTRVLLCSATTGRPHAMTDNHHPESRPEATRLRRSPGSALVTDSFGETRFMGALANTRCLGDLRFKPYGVTAEPEVRSKLLENGEWACVILASDGVTSLVSDGEMCGIARHARTPQDAASAILSYAEEMGSEDNGTVLVLPLAGWGQVQGPDSTAELRKYRSSQMSERSTSGQSTATQSIITVGSERQRRM